MLINAVLNLQTVVRSNCDFNCEDDKIGQNFFNCGNSLCAGEPSLSENTVMSRGDMPLLVSGEELNEHIRLLNKKEREVFDTVYLWAISYMKNLMSHTHKKTTVHPFYLS